MAEQITLKKKTWFQKLIQICFCDTKSKEFSLTKTGMVVMNTMAFLFLIVQCVCDINDRSLSEQTVKYASTLFGFGSPISFATYLINRIGMRAAEAKNGNGNGIPPLPGGPV